MHTLITRPSFKYLLFTVWITMSIRIRADDDFVYDYFVHKSVPRVTIFSCEKTENDFRFIRRMSNLGIFVSVGHPRLNSYNVTDHATRRDNWVLGLLLDTRCQTREINEKIFAQTTKYRLYEGIHIWLIIASKLEEITQLLNDTSYSPLTDLVLAVETDRGYELHDVYNPSKIHGGTLNVTRMGFWNKKNGLEVTLTQEKFHRRSNLHGMMVRVGAIIKYQPAGVAIEDHLQNNEKKSEDFRSKYGYAIIRHLGDLYNFTISITKFSEQISVTVNGTEDGLMAGLFKGEIDIIASLCSANARFASYGRISMPGYPYRTFFLLRSNVETLRWTEFLAPFALDSWYAIGLMSILAIATITTIQMTEYEEGWFTESGHAIFATIGVMCQQGLTFVPNRLAGRVGLLFLLFFGVLLVNYYSASIVSVRLSQPPDKMNDSLYSLAKSHTKVASEPVFVVDDNLNSRSLIEWEVRYFNEKVWKKLPQSRYEQLEEGLGKAAQGGYAYHTSPEVAYPYVDTHWDDRAICEMTEVHVLTPRILSFYEKTDSPFTEMIKIGLIKTANMGLQTRTVKRWKPKIPYCSPLTRSSESVTFYEIAPAVVMLTIGSFVAVMMYQVERIFEKIQPTTITRLGAPKIHRTGGKKTLLRN